MDQGQGQRYEYKTIKVDRYSRRKVEKTLNRYAAEGWELDEVQRKSLLAFGSKETAVLRRPIPQQ